MAGKEFPEINERLRMEIELILERARYQNLTSKIAEIYWTIHDTLGEKGLHFLKEQRSFPFAETILAWNEFLTEMEIEKWGINKMDVLIGIIWSTVFHECRKKEGDEE